MPYGPKKLIQFKFGHSPQANGEKAIGILQFEGNWWSDFLAVFNNFQLILNMENRNLLFSQKSVKAKLARNSFLVANTQKCTNGLLKFQNITPKINKKQNVYFKGLID